MGNERSDLSCSTGAREASVLSAMGIGRWAKEEVVYELPMPMIYELREDERPNLKDFL